MKRIATTLLLGAAALLGAATTHAQTYQQVWADEFTNGIGPNWVFETGGGGWGNNEKQYYQRANATVVNGVLQITARKENVGGMPYTSARMKTQGLKDFKYGRIEARMKVPQGQGMWPAFWMLGSNIGSVGWPKCGEIDIMEHVNTDNKVYGTVHWDSNGHAQYGGNTTTTLADWHVYSVEWTATSIKWFVDGAQYHTIDITNGTGSTEEFQNPFFILLNLAVAGDWPGQTVDESKLPATMQVDYVRVYQQTSGTPTASAITLQAEAANVNSGMQAEACADTGGGQDMGYIDKGDYLVFNSINFPVSGNYTIDYRVASPGGGTISSDLNAGSTQLGSTTIPATGGWQSWQTVSRTVYVNAGTYNFGVFAQTSGFNLNWVRITPPSGTARTATAATPDATTSLTLYPNPRPAGEPLTLALPSFDAAHPATMRLLDAQGREVWRTTATSPSVEVAPTQRLSSGMYLLQVNDATGRTTQKLVVQ